MPDILEFKLATKKSEFEQIHRLNYETFVEEIPRYQSDSSNRLVDKYNDKTSYVVCVSADEVLGMLSILSVRPFSLDNKLEGLDSYLPDYNSICEIRLLAVKKAVRRGRILLGLIETTVQYCLDQGHDIAVISGILKQQKLYRHMGFVPFGPVVGTPEASFQPMYLTPQGYAGAMKVAEGSIYLPPRKVNLLPGPVDIASHVQDAFNLPYMSHRSEAFMRMHRDTRRLLTNLVGSEHVEMFMGSGTLANDVIAGQLSLHSGSGIVISNGEFGERLVGRAERFRLNFETLSVEWGKPFEAEAIEAALKRMSRVKWIWAVHCETSTGMLNDIAMLKEICRTRNILLALDAVSSIGNVAVDLQDVYLASGVSGKGLRSYSGIAMVFYNHQLSRSHRTLPEYIDLQMYAQKNGVPFTINSNLVRALQKSLEEIDIAEITSRNLELSHWLRQEIKKIGLEVLVEPRHSCAFVLTIVLPKTVDAKKVGERLTARGYLLSYASRYLVERNWIQMCLMSDVPTQTLRQLLAELRHLCLES